MDWTAKDAEGYGAIIGIDWETAEFSPEDLLEGMLVELEHKRLTGGDPLASAEIALDHLSESPEYYDFLEEVEEKFKKKARFMRHRFATSLEDLEVRYPTLFAEVRKLEPGYSIFALPKVEKSRNPRLLLEKFAVYQVLTTHGPDVVGFNIGQFLPKVRKVAGDILEAWETGTLYNSLDELGWFGPKSDVLRGPADRYYSYRGAEGMRRRRRRIARKKPVIFSQYMIVIRPVDQDSAMDIKEEAYSAGAAAVEINSLEMEEYEVISSFEPPHSAKKFEDYLYSEFE